MPWAIISQEREAILGKLAKKFLINWIDFSGSAFVTGTQNNQSFKHIILSSEVSEKVKLIMGHDGSDKKQNWTYSSDHASFYTKNIPFLYFGVEDHNDYHQPTDDFDKINKEFYKEVVKTIISVFVTMDEYLK